MMTSQDMNKREFLKYGLTATGALVGASLMGLAGETSEKLWKWSKEGLYWSPTPRGAKCLICPNECIIKEGETGICHNRINLDGKLYSIAYGNPCAINIDPIEKKPLNHFFTRFSGIFYWDSGLQLCLSELSELDYLAGKSQRNTQLRFDAR